MGICEQRSGSGEGIDGGSACLRMTMQAADPVILVINRNHQDIWSPGGCLRCCHAVREEDEDEMEQQPESSVGGGVERTDSAGSV